jgi:hypothetical protein
MDSLIKCDMAIHPYGPFKLYTDWNSDIPVVQLHKPWNVVEANMTRNFNNLHAHVHRDSRDCDGPTESSYVQMASETNFNDYTEDPLNKRYCPEYWTNFTPCTNEAEFRYTMLDLDEYDNGELGYRFTQHSDDSFDRYRENDEGGGTYEEITFCYDWSCNVEEKHYRDVYAEQMGY